MARTKKDRVMPHLVRAQMALRREEDAHLARLLEQAITHRAATVASGQPRTSGPQLDKRVVKAVDFIHANLGDQRMTVDGIAAAAGASKFFLSRLFGATMGVPPAAYVRQKRLELVREMLAHRMEVPIVHVALKSGFGSQSQMSAAFKQAFGLSPAAFRKRAAQQRR